MLYYSLRRWRDANNYSALAKGLVTKDVLTQSFNRRALESKLLQEWRRFERYREPFTIILIHIDDFKDINYAFNHQEGDRVIIEVAKNYKLIFAIQMPADDGLALSF